MRSAARKQTVHRTFLRLLILGLSLAAGFVPVSFASAGSSAPSDLNGEWRSGDPNQPDRIMILQIGSQITATQISEGFGAPAGTDIFRGSYDANSFPIEARCASHEAQSAEEVRGTVTVRDATHMKTAGVCQSDITWTRFGPPIIAIDASKLFEFDKVSLTQSARSTLEPIAAMLNEFHPDADIHVNGYTDNQGTIEHNLQLSTHRARAIGLWFEMHGFHGSHVSAKGFGVNEPRYPNTTEQGRAHNRRIEIVIEP
jgi:outer membrane protein OmpA-like peptidoglycan-associated protein